MDQAILRDWFLRAKAHVPGIDVELVDCRWSPGYRAATSPEHIISLSLTPILPNASARLAGGGQKFSPLGNVLFMPSQTELGAQSSGGYHRILRCRFAESRFRDLTGYQGGGWSRSQLAASVDLTDLNVALGLRRLANELLQPGFATDAMVEMLAGTVALDLLRSLRCAAEEPRGKALSARQLRYLEERIANPSLALPNVAELAALIGISSRHLLREYRAATGSTLRARLQWASQSRAASLLVTTELPLKVIAHRLGFKSHSSFSTSFLHATGESPSAYRNRHR